jgi:hypothetical protein
MKGNQTKSVCHYNPYCRRQRGGYEKDVFDEIKKNNMKRACKTITSKRMIKPMRVFPPKRDRLYDTIKTNNLIV